MPQECPNRELRNEHPLDMPGLAPEFPFMASLWIWSGECLATKGIDVSAQTYQVGAHFEALTMDVLVVPSKEIEEVFSISSFPAGQCPSLGPWARALIISRPRTS